MFHKNTKTPFFKADFHNLFSSEFHVHPLLFQTRILNILQCSFLHDDRVAQHVMERLVFFVEEGDDEAYEKDDCADVTPDVPQYGTSGGKILPIM